MALNRVVGNSTAPSQILGNIKSDGTVLVINQNGIIFGGSAQINVGSLIATSLDVGAQPQQGAADSIQARNKTFLQEGLIGLEQATQALIGTGGNLPTNTFTSILGSTNNGPVQVQAGASIVTNGSDGP